MPNLVFNGNKILAIKSYHTFLMVKMNFVYFFVVLIYVIESKLKDLRKIEFCKNFICDDSSTVNVCGIKKDGEGFYLKLFKNECQLLKYGCNTENEIAYGIINVEYCDKAFKQPYFIGGNDQTEDKMNDNMSKENKAENCSEIDCTYEKYGEQICAIRKDDAGYRITLFPNKCELTTHNCESNQNFTETDLYICSHMLTNSSNGTHYDDTTKIESDNEDGILKNLVIVNTNSLDFSNDINETVNTFFAATHVFDLPMKEVAPDLVNEITRRRLIKIAGPVKVFQPWTIIPKNITDDKMHSPTLSSCYHKCPKKCPDTYAPVCGVPGIVAREPSLMFKNHCFMDVAQCKMRWEEKSPTALSSSYIESSFMFCLGDQLNGLYRFLPLVRTLQHMGRLKKKGHFRYKLRNLRFFNNLISRDPNLMGK